MKVTIVLEDTVGDNVMVQVLADPPIDTWDDENLEGSQYLALQFIDTLEMSIGEEDVQ